jgi:branched-chain amino acid transport system permease protein
LEYWLQVLINGLLLGGVYALGAIGFSLIWGVMDIINIAHGAFIMLGAFVTWVLFTGLGLDPFLVIPVIIVLFFGAGYLIQLALLNRIVEKSIIVTLLITLGIEYILINAAIEIWGADFRSVDTAYSSEAFVAGFIVVPYVKLVTLVIALVAAAVLAYFLKRTNTGQAIRATAQNFGAARLQGINVYRIFAITFGISMALAGIAGVMLSMNQPFSPLIAPALTLKAFVVAILGGLGSVWGAVIGGIALAIIETLGGELIGVEFQTAIAFVLFVVVLVVRHGSRVATGESSA